MNPMKPNIIRSRFPKANILTHTDLDGYASAAVVVTLLTNAFGYELTDINIVHTVPSAPYTLEPGFTIITDLSVNSNSNWDTILKYHRDPNNVVWWIDHHVTSQDIIRAHPELEEIPSIICTKCSATMLAYILFDVLTEHERMPLMTVTYGPDVNLTDPDSIATLIHCLNNNLDCYASDPLAESTLDHIFACAPYLVRLVDDWDCFKHKIPDSQYFNSAFYTCPTFLHDPMSIFFQSALLQDEDRAPIHIHSERGAVQMTRHERYLNAAFAIEYFVKFGKTASKWQHYLYLRNFLSSGVVCNLDTDDKEVSKIDFVALNRTDYNMSIGARLLLMQINWGIAFEYKDRGFSYTVYCRHPQHLNPEADRIYDAKEVCSLFGGGGHPGCAGFTSPKIVFKNVRPLTDNMKFLIKKELRDLQGELEPVLEDQSLWQFLHSCL